MPALSLVVCFYNQRDLLERLLRESAGCYDDLVVVHDGPDVGGARAAVEAAGGRFFEGPRAGQQEPHWPFAWGQAANDWILKLDADEFPSAEMKPWLQKFRTSPEPEPAISGFTCIWPLWNGHRAISKKYWDGRLLLFDRRRVRFFGMVEQGTVPDGRYVATGQVLHHQPKRRSYGVRNILVRKQTYRWRALIAQSLLGKPTDFPCWRWDSDAWPADWEQIRRHPLRTALTRPIRGTLRELRDQWKRERRFFPTAALTGPLHHLMICLTYWRVRRRQG